MQHTFSKQFDWPMYDFSCLCNFNYLYDFKGDLLQYDNIYVLEL